MGRCFVRRFSRTDFLFSIPLRVLNVKYYIGGHQQEKIHALNVCQIMRVTLHGIVETNVGRWLIFKKEIFHFLSARGKIERIK